MITDIPLFSAMEKACLNLHIVNDPLVYRSGKTTVESAHIHNCYELYLNLSGDVSFLVEQTLYPITRGDIIITMPNELHHCVYNSDCEHRNYCLWFDVEDNDSELLSLFVNRKRGQQNLICLNETNKTVATAYLQTIYENRQKNELTSVSTLAAFYSLMDLLNQSAFEHSNALQLPSLFKDILNYIDCNLHERCTMDEICSRFYISRTTLYRMFKQHLNLTPSKYIEDKRFARAKILLEEKKELREICIKCGFNDYSYFITTFKKKFGITPYQYVKSLK